MAHDNKTNPSGDHQEDIKTVHLDLSPTTFRPETPVLSPSTIYPMPHHTLEETEFLKLFNHPHALPAYVQGIRGPDSVVSTGQLRLKKGCLEQEFSITIQYENGPQTWKEWRLVPTVSDDTP